MISLFNANSWLTLQLHLCTKDIMNTHLLTNARIITPSENFLGSVEIEDGIITNISKRVYTSGIDLNEQWLAPGCIDIHTDYLEKELHPRPEANFSLPFALHYLDSRARRTVASPPCSAP
jgi:alpha-D-ribose 1-methylphosphonate 5-triphosphate diphosphatase